MNILIIEDEWLVSDGVAMNVRKQRPDAQLRQAASLKEAFQLLETDSEVDLIILDLKLPDSEGVGTLTRVRDFLGERNIVTRVVVLSASSDRDLVVDVLKAHGTGFIVKARPAEEFADALASTLRGTIYIPPSVLDYLEPKIPDPPEKGKKKNRRVDGEYPECLTPRERDVCDWLVDGLTYKQIAQEISKADGTPLSDNTVRKHVNNVADKLLVKGNVKAGVMVALSRLEIQSRRAQKGH